MPYGKPDDITQQVFGQAHPRSNFARNQWADAEKAKLKYRLAIALRSLIIQAVGQELTGVALETEHQLEAIATAVQDAQRRDRKAIEKVHKRIAAKMQADLLVQYEKLVEARKRVKEPYRPGSRDTGFLKTLLEIPNMVVGTSDGIQYINAAVLDKDARQWRRLQFGAGRAGNASKKRGIFPLMFGNWNILDLTLDDPVSQPFSLPGNLTKPGMYFYQEGGGRIDDPVQGKLMPAGWVPPNRNFPAPLYFYKHGPLASAKFMPFKKEETKGIAARRFMDHPLSILAEELGPEYEQLLDHWIREAVRNSRGPLSFRDQ